jgi:(4-O-methyl)-D-glucuronate---lignin esterase
MRRHFRFALALCPLAIAHSQAALSQDVHSSHMPPPVTFTAEQDRQNMLHQLGIKALRPGPSGDEQAPNDANYDESNANPFPDLPDPLLLENGQKVTTATMWWHERRPQIVEMFEKDVYGRVPANTARVTWNVTTVDQEKIGFRAVVAKDLIGHVDNSAYPLIDVNIHMTLVTPADAKRPVPVLIMFGHAGFPAPNEPQGADMARINKAWKELLVQQDPTLTQVFEQHPAWQPVRNTPFQFPQLNEDGGLPSTWQLIAAGWGFALLDPASVQADNAAGLTRGIIGLMNKGQPRRPEDWGALRAWAWGAGRALDYLATNPSVDAKHRH